ncbi:ABC transporter substrate-binding protein [Sorangium cellulosum]|uniref:Thiamine pyrimidine synthase n=1 Tax=Sorangium cellulosum TaxID=56 RepID=A0A4P2Q576_SORCE|nr:ABC transporter substrate-binding protein [Sorangium cellulosum]AUX24519.1 ABC transporter substrate-binding protein [Sorangium cellulosum]
MHSTARRRLFLQRLAALAALPLLAPACSRSQAPGGDGSSPSPSGAQGAPPGSAQAAPGGAQAVKVKLALNWVPEPEFGGFYAARESGAFAKENLEVEILGGGAGAPVVQMVAGGQVDFGISGADEVLTARARGADVLPLFTVFQTSPQAIMTHASRGAKGIADVLKSGTLAIEPGLPYAAYLKKKYGFDKVKVVPYDGGVARFVADKDLSQQCFITAEPIAAKRKGSDPATFLVADEGFNPYVAVVITRAALWKENPERVRAFVRAVRQGWRAYLDDPTQANAVMAKLNTSMDAETFIAAAEAQKPLIETAETKEKGLGVMTRARWETLAKQLVDLGILEKMPPIDDLLVAL